MVETALAWFGLSLPAALDLTVAQFRVHHRAQRRVLRDQHERDLRLAWFTAAMTNKPISYRALERLIAGKPEVDPEIELRRERILAEFDDAYRAEKEAERAIRAGQGARPVPEGAPHGG